MTRTRVHGLQLTLAVAGQRFCTLRQCYCAAAATALLVRGRCCMRCTLPCNDLEKGSWAWAFLLERICCRHCCGCCTKFPNTKGLCFDVAAHMVNKLENWHVPCDVLCASSFSSLPPTFRPSVQQLLVCLSMTQNHTGTECITPVLTFPPTADQAKNTHACLPLSPRTSS